MLYRRYELYIFQENVETHINGSNSCIKWIWSMYSGQAFAAETFTWRLKHVISLSIHSYVLYYMAWLEIFCG